MLDNHPIASVPPCDNPIQRNLELSQKLRIMGTPAILFASNFKSPGYTNAVDIEAKLAVAK